MRRIILSALLLLLAAGCDKGPVGWQRTIDLGGDETATAIAHDGNNLYVSFTATSPASPDRAGWFITKYSRDGNEVWTRSFKESPFAVCADIAADPLGYCYAAGRIKKDGRDMGLVIRHGIDGSVHWQKALAIGDRTELAGIALAGEGRVALTGLAGTLPNPDLLVQLVEAATGNTVWSRTFDLAAGDRGHRIAADGRGNLALIAARAGGEQSDVLVMKLNAGGDSLWTRTYDSGGDDQPGDVAFDPLGNIIATATARVGDSLRCVILEYDPDGGVIRKAAWGEQAQAEGRAVAITPAADIFIGASLRRPGAGADKRDLLIFDYRPNASSVWERRHSAGTSARLADIVVTNDVFVAATVTNKTDDVLLLRFTRLPVAQRE